MKVVHSFGGSISTSELRKSRLCVGLKTFLHKAPAAASGRLLPVSGLGAPTVRPKHNTLRCPCPRQCVQQQSSAHRQPRVLLGHPLPEPTTPVRKHRKKPLVRCCTDHSVDDLPSASPDSSSEGVVGSAFALAGAWSRQPKHVLNLSHHPAHTSNTLPQAASPPAAEPFRRLEDCRRGSVP
jgi:hypothetical protein